VYTYIYVYIHIINGIHQLLVHADDVNILEQNERTIKEKAEALVVASKKVGVEVNADKLSTWSCLEIRMQDEVTI
jgi:hypothetical protein